MSAAAASMSAIRPTSLLFGDQLVNPQGKKCEFPEVPPGGVIGLYFTAQCFINEFTPELLDFCRRYVPSANDDIPRRPLQIIVISLDDSKQEFEACRASTLWPALGTCDEQGMKVFQRLQRRYRYRQLPCLMLVEADDGRLITDLGRQSISSDPAGLKFPWQLPSVETIFGNGQLLNGPKDVVDSRQALDGKIKGLYFASSECAPCHDFTPALAYTYARLKSSGQKFEVVLVSADDHEDEFKAMYSSMPWLAVPFGDNRIQQLLSTFQVYGYPQLILLNEENNIITADGRNLIAANIDGSNYPWPIQKVEELHDDNDIILRIRPCLILLTDGGRQDLVQHAASILNIAATENSAQLPTAGTKHLHLFYEGQQSSDVMDTVYGILQLRDRQMPDGSILQPRVVITDFPEDRFFVCWSDQNSAADAVTEESIRHLVIGFYSGQLLMRPLPDP